MPGRTGSFAAAVVIACTAAGCHGVTITRDVDYDTAAATVAALVSAVAGNNQARVDQLTTHPDAPPPSRESLAILANAFSASPASSTVADSSFNDPTGAMNDMANLRRYFSTVGTHARYEWDPDFHALSVVFECAPSDGPRCVNRLYFTFDHTLGDSTRVDMMIGVRNNPAWAKVWKDSPNSHGLAPAAPALAIEKAFAQFE